MNCRKSTGSRCTARTRLPISRRSVGRETGVRIEAPISAFLNYAKIEKGLSSNTIAAYTRDLRKFAAFVEARGLEVKAVGRDDVVDFLSELYRQKLDSRSVARHLVSLRNLFRFAQTEELISIDPTLNLESPTLRKSLP